MSAMLPLICTRTLLPPLPGSGRVPPRLHLLGSAPSPFTPISAEHPASPHPCCPSPCPRRRRDAPCVPPPFPPQLLSAVPGARRRAPEGHSHGRETLLGRRPSAAKTAVLQVGLCVGRGTGGGSAAAAAGRCPAAGGGRPLEGSTEQPGRPHAPPPPGGGDRGGAACPRVSPRSPPCLCGPAAGLLPPLPDPPLAAGAFPFSRKAGGMRDG